MRWIMMLLLTTGLTTHALAQDHPDPVAPDDTLTPGDFHKPPTPLAVLCAPGYTKTVRSVSAATKNVVLREYGYDPATVKRGRFEIDHLISLELDGTNSVMNLWPESYVTMPLNAHRKDVLENNLKHRVCSGKMSLSDAQAAISTNWMAAYLMFVRKATR